MASVVHDTRSARVEESRAVLALMWSTWLFLLQPLWTDEVGANLATIHTHAILSQCALSRGIVKLLREVVRIRKVLERSKRAGRRAYQR